jgi:hypothetical protein
LNEALATEIICVLREAEGVAGNARRRESVRQCVGSTGLATELIRAEWITLVPRI